jgi:hypothetical protein
MWKKSILFFVLLASVLACSTEDGPEILEAFGTIEDSPANFEECDWVINVDGQYLKPLRIPEEYEVDGLNVYFTYEDLNSQEVCQEPGETLSRIRLVQIRVR